MTRFRPLALALVAALIAVACSGTDEPQLTQPAPTAPSTSSTTSTMPDLAFAEDDDSRTLRVSVPSFSFVAPHAVDETNAVEVLTTDLLTDGLTAYDPSTRQIMPAIAESWTTSKDRLVWTFVLRDMSFSTGEPVTAVDAMTSLNRLAARGIDSLSGPNLSVVAGYDAVAAGTDDSMEGVVSVDDRTLEITLLEPYEPILELLAGVSFGIFPVDIDTTGSLPLSSSVDFTPTAKWEDGFRMMATSDAGPISTIEVWEDRTGDLIADRDVDMALGLEEGSTLSVRAVSVERSADAYFAMNSAIPPFDDPLVRQAIVHAVDRKRIRRDFFPDDELMLSLVPESIVGGSEDACGGLCTNRTTRAARFVSGSAVATTPLTVDYFISGVGDDTEQRLAEVVVEALREVGLLATARAHPIDDYGTRIANGELGLFRFGSVSAIPSADAELAEAFMAGGSDNVTSTAIEEFDSLLAEARSTPDVDARAALYQTADATLMSQAVVLPLVRFTQRLWLGESVAPATLEPDGSLDLSSIEFADTSR